MGPAPWGARQVGTCSGLQGGPGWVPAQDSDSTCPLVPTASPAPSAGPWIRAEMLHWGLKASPAAPLSLRCPL